MLLYCDENTVSITEKFLAQNDRWSYKNSCNESRFTVICTVLDDKRKMSYI